VVGEFARIVSCARDLLAICWHFSPKVVLAFGESPRHEAITILAPEVGFEPTTNRLTADRSTTELLWIVSPGD
jgi:hypothetical protein